MITKHLLIKESELTGRGGEGRRGERVIGEKITEPESILEKIKDVSVPKNCSPP